jgi:hypothetical protein
MPYVNGRERGIAREWYDNGQIKSEQGRLDDGLHGVSRIWDPNGQLRREARGELGVVIASREWDAQGNLVKEYQLGPSDDTYRELVTKRAIWPKDIFWKEWPGKSVWEMDLPSPDRPSHPARPPGSIS